MIRIAICFALVGMFWVAFCGCQFDPKGLQEGSQAGSQEETPPSRSR